MSQTKLCHHSPRPTTTHHHTPPSTTSQNISTTTHHHSPSAKRDPPLPTTTHRHPLPPLTTGQNISTTTQKMDHHPVKAKIYSCITSFWYCFNSFFFFEMQYYFPWRRLRVTKFWNSKFLLYFTIFKTF